MAKTGPKRTDREAEADLIEITRLWIQQLTHEEIMEQLNKTRPYKLTRGQISIDLAKVLDRWKGSAVQNIQIRKNAELARIDALEREAWAAWNRSTKDRTQKGQTMTFRKGTGDDEDEEGKQTTVRITSEIGDPRFLAIVFQCIECRRQMLGLDAPKVQQLTGPDGNPLAMGSVIIELPDNGRPMYQEPGTSTEPAAGSGPAPEQGA